MYKEEMANKWNKNNTISSNDNSCFYGYYIINAKNTTNTNRFN